MINTQSMIMLVNDMIRRYKHVYAPMISIVIRAASFYGIVIIFAYFSKYITLRQHCLE